MFTQFYGNLSPAPQARDGFTEFYGVFPDFMSVTALVFTTGPRVSHYRAARRHYHIGDSHRPVARCHYRIGDSHHPAASSLPHW